MGVKIAILISGGGSNMVALARAARADRLGGGEIAVVICNRADADGIDKARRLKLPVVTIDHTDFPSRAAHEAAVLATLARYKIRFILLAGYMRLLTPAFVRRFPHRILNTHPALLPAFPGAHGVRDALSHGVKVTGCTVHFVVPAVDSGPIIAQAAMAVQDGDSEASLQKKIQKLEHRLYPAVVRDLCLGKFVVKGRRVLKK